MQTAKVSTCEAIAAYTGRSGEGLSGFFIHVSSTGFRREGGYVL